MRCLPLRGIVRRMPCACLRGNRLFPGRRAVLFIPTGRRPTARQIHADGGTIMTRNRIARGLMFTLWLGASAGMLAQSGSVAYDSKAEVTVSGKILHLVSFAAPDGAVGVHFDLQTPAGLLNVHVAPALFIGQSNFWFFADHEI